MTSWENLGENRDIPTNIYVVLLFQNNVTAARKKNKKKTTTTAHYMYIYFG